MSNQKALIGVLVVGLLAGLGIYLYREFRSSGARSLVVGTFLRDPASQSKLVMKAGTKCGSAPFTFPTDGLIGYLWDDSFRPGHRHQGLDIFARTEVGVTPVNAAYPGYLTRQPDWKSSVIVRVPSDPLMPGRQLWVYYTHMADKNGNSYISADFPPGTNEKYIGAETFLGYQGNYSGDPNNPVGVHLHISIVKDDGAGHFKNELDINNTYDPSPYFGLALNANQNTDQIPVCAGGQ
jgi:peptidoglycan LD-endopeptidase LytH